MSERRRHAYQRVAPRLLATTLGALLGLLLVACSDAPRAEPGASGGPAAPQLPRSAQALAGSFRLEAAWDPDPLPLNAEFRLRFRLLDADGEPLEVRAEDLRVDADMPEHLHGMTVRPGLRREGQLWVAEPLLFHMPGAWEIYVDRRAGAVTERALLTVEVR